MSFYDEIEIEDMEYIEELQTFYYPCPCGDKFEITLEDLECGEEVARCPSCSLIIKVIYDEEFIEGLLGGLDTQPIEICV